jgi:hypothetical protein
LEKEKNLVEGRVGNDRSFAWFSYAVMTMMDFDRQLDLNKLHWTWGWEAVPMDVKSAWWTVFERYRRAKVNP